MESQSEGSSRPKPLVFHKMEMLVRRMQSQESGVPVRCQKLFLTTIPSAFMGYDLVEWLMENLPIEDSAEALHLSTLLCQHGYFFPVGDARTLQVKDDSSLYRFQTPYYWPSQNHSPDSTDYAIYLHKKINKTRQKGSLDEYELECYSQLKKSLATKWDFISMQADEQLKMAKDRKKGDKIVSESQERAYWRVYRPPPGFTNALELPLVPQPSRAPGTRPADISSLRKQVIMLGKCVSRSRVRVSQVVDALMANYETYLEFDPLLTPVLPSNPWLTDDPTFMELNQKLVECPTEQRVRRWAINVHEVVSDPTGLAEFTKYMKKEFCHENIRFWMAVYQLKKAPLKEVSDMVQSIYNEFLRPGAPCEINIDGKTMELTQERMKKPDRTSFDCAAEHIFELLLKKDCYPRFLRSEQYKTLLLSATNPTSKKRFFPFGAAAKKKISTISPPTAGQLAAAGATFRPDECNLPTGGVKATGGRLEDQPYRRDAEDAGIFLGDTGGAAASPAVNSLSERSNPAVASSLGVRRRVSITKDRTPTETVIEETNQLKSSSSAPGPIDAVVAATDRLDSSAAVKSPLTVVPCAVTTVAATVIPKTVTATIVIPKTVTATTVIPKTVTATAVIPKTVTATTVIPKTVTATTVIPKTVTATTVIPKTVISTSVGGVTLESTSISQTPVQKLSSLSQQPKTLIDPAMLSSQSEAVDSTTALAGTKVPMGTLNTSLVASQGVGKLVSSVCTPNASTSTPSKAANTSLTLGTNTQVTSVLSSGGIPSVSASSIPVSTCSDKNVSIVGEQQSQILHGISSTTQSECSDSKKESVSTSNKKALSVSATNNSTESTEDILELASGQAEKTHSTDLKLKTPVVGSSPCGIAPPPLMFQDTMSSTSSKAPTVTLPHSVKPFTSSTSQSTTESLPVVSEVSSTMKAEGGKLVEKSQRKTQIVTLTDSCAQTVETGDNPIYETADPQHETSASTSRKSHGARRREKRSSEQRRSQESGQSKERRSMKKKQENVKPGDKNADLNEQSTSKSRSQAGVNDQKQKRSARGDASGSSGDTTSTATALGAVSTNFSTCTATTTPISASAASATSGTKLTDSIPSTAIAIPSSLSLQASKMRTNQSIEAKTTRVSVEHTEKPSGKSSSTPNVAKTTSEPSQVAVCETILAAKGGNDSTTFSSSHRSVTFPTDTGQ